MSKISLLRKIFYPPPGGSWVIIKTLAMLTLPSTIFISCVAGIAASSISSSPPPAHDLTYINGIISPRSDLSDGQNAFLSNGKVFFLYCSYPHVQGRGSRCLEDTVSESKYLNIGYWPKYNLLMSVYDATSNKSYLTYEDSAKFIAKIQNFSIVNQLKNIKNNAVYSMIYTSPSHATTFVILLVIFIPNLIGLVFMRAFNK